MSSRGGISYVLAKRAKPHRRDEMRVTTAVVALILTAQTLRSLARRLDPRRARLEAAQWPPPPIPATPTDPSIKD